MWVAALTTCSMGVVTAADWPERLTLHEESRSPDGHYGIVVTTSSHVDDGNTTLLPEEGEEFVDYFADPQTHRLLGKIKGFEYVDHEKHAQLDAQWTPDSKLCVATYWNAMDLRLPSSCNRKATVSRKRTSASTFVKRSTRRLKSNLVMWMRMYIHNFISSLGREFAFTPRPAIIPNSLKTPRPIMLCFRASSSKYKKIDGILRTSNYCERE